MARGFTGLGRKSNIAGLKALLENWDDVLDLVKTREAYDIYKKSASVIENAMKKQVPIDEGKVRDGIHSGPVRRRTMKKRYGMNNALGSFIRQDYSREVVPKGRRTKQGFPVALLLEFGSRNMSPRPYFRPTWEKLKRTQYNRIVRQLERLMRKRAKKLKRLVNSGARKDLARKRAMRG